MFDMATWSMAAVLTAFGGSALAIAIFGTGLSRITDRLADVAYRGGSIYHAISDQQLYIMALAILLSGLLLMGLLRREKHGIANIGFESFLILLTYFAAFLGLALAG